MQNPIHIYTNLLVSEIHSRMYYRFKNHVHGCKIKKGRKNEPEIKHLHPIHQPRPLHIKLQHLHLSLPQRLRPLRIKTSRVLHARAQHPAQHPRANLVVLLIRRGRLNGNRPRAQEIHVLHLGRVGGFHGCAGGFANALREEAPDAEADDGVREVAIVEDGVDVFAA